MKKCPYILIVGTNICVLCIFTVSTGLQLLHFTRNTASQRYISKVDPRFVVREMSNSEGIFNQCFVQPTPPPPQKKKLYENEFSPQTETYPSPKFANAIGRYHYQANS